MSSPLLGRTGDALCEPYGPAARVTRGASWPDLFRTGVGGGGCKQLRRIGEPNGEPNSATGGTLVRTAKS